MPPAGTTYEPTAALPVLATAELVEVAVALPRAEVAEVRKEVTSALMLLWALLTLDDKLLRSLERLLRTSGAAVAATEEMLEATEAADASIDE